jgi:heavy metal translocating P-type ATPase
VFYVGYCCIIKVMLKKIHDLFHKWTPIIVALALVVALFLHLTSLDKAKDYLLGTVLFVFSIPLWIDIVVSIYNKKFGVDLVAGLALLASVVFGEYLPGVIVLLMLSGGEALESYAIMRARKSLSELLTLMPSKAHLKTESGISDIDSEKVTVGVHLIVKAGEVVPVDGIVQEGESFVDESIMTGESMPVEKKVGSMVLAGTINTTSVIVIKVTKPLSESRLQTIIEMVRKAEEDKAPFVRLADKYSVYFTIFTILMAGLAFFISHDPIRLLAVLVVATPCPLILATPIAFMSGMSSASRKGIIVKNGAALEALDRVKTFVFDKTGTITLGVPSIHSVLTFSSLKEKEITHISSSLDQLSVHVLAKALIEHNKSQASRPLSYPDKFKETFGDGVEGEIEGNYYIFGKLSFINSKGVKISDSVTATHNKELGEGIMSVYLANANEVLGAILFQDQVRPDVKNLFENLNKKGIKRMILLSGDKEVVASHIAASVGIKEYKAEFLPDQKLGFIKDLQEKDKNVVAMVGDGINDAPALMKADVGIALGSHGSTAASDSADIVIISGSVGLTYDAYLIARKSLSVAREGILIGIGLSSVCMIIALMGHLPPFMGALIQEGIDVAVILYALRAGTEVKNR